MTRSAEIGNWRVVRRLLLATCLVPMWNLSLRGDDDPAAKIVLSEPAVPESMPRRLKELNKELGQEVLPASNAVVDLLTVFEDHLIPEDCRTDFYRMLGVESVPAGLPRLVFPRRDLPMPKGDRYRYALNTDIPAYRSGGNNWRQSAAWSKTDYPDFFWYLELHRNALDRFAAATKKDAFYCPVVEGPRKGSTRLFRLLAPEPAELLLERAMNRLHSKDLPGALDDVLACRRFCSLIACHPIDLGEMLTIADLDRRAFQAESELVATNKLTPRQVRLYCQELRKLPSPASFAAVCGRHADRFDAAIEFARTQVIGTPLDHLPVVSNFGIKVRRWPPDTDWAIARKQMDEMLAAYIQIMQTPPRSAGDWEQRFEALQRSHQKSAEANSVPGPVEHRSRAAGVTLFLSQFRADDVRYVSRITSIRTRRSVSIAGLAALAYRLERGTYPASLSVLKPAYLSDIPLDAHTGGALVYRRLYGNAPPIVFGKGEDWHDGDVLGDDIPLWLP